MTLTRLQVFLFVYLCVCVHVCASDFVQLCVCEFACFRVCALVHICVCVCVCAYLVLIDRPEDHCGCSDPVSEEAVGCDDPDRLLSQCLCSDWTAALHGEPAE